MYGRSDEAWDQLASAGLKFLVERAQLRKVTTYTEMNSVLARRTGLPRFDFEQADERAAMGHLLGLIVERDYPETRLMISALVHYLGANDAGPGFYTLAQQLGLLPKGSSATVKLQFWIEQVNSLHKLHARS
ncbi:hypothetical protein GA0115260_106403 [Streptomyces sp. MnatMP-M27]|uniref:hypothetical protein n=1 Tax=Streptomyces sp. MnatMP-M27 TaxID=1839768 RepID=UPI00081DDECA|nr:hypothetical protein [Streptomyces sp. MnatMP-M27]SCG02366.1 hypothetical protein GA0115260_106403 [Streptomyces sp. MnatMP-M27]